MERLFKLLFLLPFLVLTACSEQSAVESKFPESVQACVNNAHPSRYIVQKTNGVIETVYAKSRQDMIDSYVLLNIDSIEFVEPDYKIELSSPYTTEKISSSLTTWGPERIGANHAWNNGHKGQDVVVAVIDSGTELTHESLKNNLYVNTAELNGLVGVDDDENGYVDDFSGYNFAENSNVNNDEIGHGTHVAGIISADNGVAPFKSVAPMSKIMPLDFMNGVAGYTSDAINAIDYAINNGARIINASWGSSGCSVQLKNKIESLQDKNILFVAAAGNSGNDLNYRPEYPAAYKYSFALTVGSMTSLGFLSSFSNYGSLVDVVAPGSQILSSYRGNSYSYLDGTSMATPMVSGLAALLLSARPQTTAQELKTIIEQSVVVKNYAVKTRGEVNYPRAIQLLNSLH